MPTQMAAQSPVKTRVFLSLIGALFILPIVAAWLLVGHWRPSGTTNHGELLNPAQPVADLRLYQMDGRELDETYLQGRWTMIYIGGRLGGCDKRCRGGLYGMRQVRLALGKDMERAQTLFIMAAKPDSALLAWLQREHAAMGMGLADFQTLAFFRQAFAGETASEEDWIYLVDPLGNLLMRYKVDSNPKGMLDDLRHLLKLSKIG